jgi:hypothetical protein
MTKLDPVVAGSSRVLQFTARLTLPPRNARFHNDHSQTPATDEAFSRQEFAERHPKCSRQLLDVKQRDVALSALDQANVCPVKPREFCEFFLGNPFRFPNLPQLATKLLEHVRQGVDLRVVLTPLTLTSVD